MAANGRGASGDTLEFLRVMGEAGGAGAAGPAAPSGRAPQAPGAPAARRATPDLPSIDEVGWTGIHAPGPEANEPRSVVIKGGPRRVVRADGRQPEVGYALGKLSFSLSSGHAMFAPKKSRSPWAVAVFALACLAALAAVFAVTAALTQRAVVHENQLAVVGTTSYDGSLSLTPADDGGYYTVFLVTGTRTDEDVVGDLSQVVMYRAADKSVSSAMRIAVPTNLYVEPTTAYPTVRTVAQVLADQGIAKALAAVDDAFGARLYNVVCCDEETFALLTGLLDGSADASSVDPDSLLGNVRTNLSLEDLVAWCASVGALDQSSLPRFAAPTTDIDVNGTVYAQGSATSFAEALQSAAFYEVVGYDDAGNPVIAQKNADGTYIGTWLDEDGNPLLDENGYPQGALWTDNGLYFDENGYLQFWGQDYDENGYPVGTRYDEWGNPLLDEWGNPAGTVYDEWGNVTYDWTGNMVISEG